MSSSKRPAATSKRTATENWPPQSILHQDNIWIPTVVFDFHEVIVSFRAAMEKYINIVHPDAEVSLDRSAFYDFAFDQTVNITPREWEGLFKTFCMLDKGGYGDCPLIPGIVEQMKKIKAAGINIEIWTWVPGASSVVANDNNPLHSGIAQRQTIDLIKRLRLPVDVERDVKFVAPQHKAWRMCEKHIALIVDDNPETAVAVAMKAHAVIVPATGYNDLAFTNVLRIDNRDEIADRVIQAFDAMRAANLVLEGRR